MSPITQVSFGPIRPSMKGHSKTISSVAFSPVAWDGGCSGDLVLFLGCGEVGFVCVLYVHVLGC